MDSWTLPGVCSTCGVAVQHRLCECNTTSIVNQEPGLHPIDHVVIVEGNTTSVPLLLRCTSRHDQTLSQSEARERNEVHGLTGKGQDGGSKKRA